MSSGTHRSWSPGHSVAATRPDESARPTGLTAERYEDLNIYRLGWALGHLEFASGDPAAACT